MATKYQMESTKGKVREKKKFELIGVSKSLK